MMAEQIKNYSYLLKDTVLSDEQNRAIDLLSHRRSMILGFQAGLGKTTICITTAKLYNLRNSAVCTFFFFPKSARAAFKKEFANRLCEEYALYSTDEIVEYSGQNYVLCEVTYMKKVLGLVKDLAKTRKLACFFDEAHCLQDPKSQISKDFKSIRPSFLVFHAVTATPLINSIEGLFTILQLIDPGKNPRWELFRARYCVTKSREVNFVRNGKKMRRRFFEVVGYKNLDKLKEYVDSICIQGAKDYNINFLYRQTKIDNAVVQSYLDASKGVFDSSMDVIPNEDPKAFGARLHDLQRIVDGAYSDKITTKTKLLLMILKEINERHEASLVYVEYDDSVELLKKFLEEYADKVGINNIHVLSGKTPEKKRVEIEQSIEPGDVVIITAAGRQSRNLQKANNLVFYDLPFSVGTITQCIGRICRCDSVFPEQNVYIVEIENTIDTYKRILFKNNLWLIRQLFSSQTTLPTDVMSVDNKMKNAMKQKLLWCR